jgi:peptidoglycan/LPS O-acetylase OafA/YrhL
MGLVRFLLASAVVLGHAGSGGFLPPYYAVQAFFLISGFYMALVHGKYAGLPVVFYLNRYSRLVVSYWIVGITTLIVIAIYPIADLPVGAKLHDGNIGSIVPLIFTNVFIVGQDIVGFFKIGGEPATDWLLIPQSWSLGAELWFYFLVPLLAPRSTKTLLCIIAATAGARVVIIIAGFPFFPWQQRFFPAELLFFLVGMLSYRSYLWASERGHLTEATGYVAWVIVTAIIVLVGNAHWATEMTARNSFALACILFLTIQPIFFLTRSSTIDRFLGEFSYPIYLWQILVLSYVGYEKVALIISIFLSIPLVLWVEVPLERWRTDNLETAANRRDQVAKPV